MRRAAIAVVATIVVTACGGATAAWPRTSVSAFTPAAHRKPPDLENHGWISKPLRIIAFVPAGYPHEAELRDWPQAIVASRWLAQVEHAYRVPTSPAPIGRGFIVHDIPVLPDHDVNTTSVFNLWVAAKFALLGIPTRPNFQTIVILFDRCTPPQSLDNFGCTSHHPLFDAAGDSYALSLGNPTGTTDAQRDALTATASHELAEAITDPSKGWRLTAIDKDHPWAFASAPNANDPEHGLISTRDASPFVEDEDLGTIESADEASGARWHEDFTPSGFANPVRYSYVRVFANAANDHGDDPAVPPSPDPYFNVSTASDWYILHLGGTKQITITGWSTRKIPAWTVTAKVSTWEHLKPHGFIPALPSPCRLDGKTSAKIANRDTFTQKIATTSNAAAGAWCLVKLTSEGTDPNGDVSHPWFVGFVLER
jgi:hypothetical protein